MKYPLLVFLFVCHTLQAQVKTVALQGYQHFNMIYSTMNLYAAQKDSVKKECYGIYNDTITKTWNTTMLKSVDGSSQFPTHNIADLDTGFNLQRELAGKVYVVDRGGAKDFYYLQHNNVWVHKTLALRIVWQLIKEDYAPLYKIDFGNNRFIYWAEGSGILFKKDGALKTNFREFEYYYPDPGTRFTVTSMDAVAMDYGYINYGVYKLALKNYHDIFAMDSSYDNSGRYKQLFEKQAMASNVIWKYTVLANGKLVADDISLRYFNKNQLIAIDKNNTWFYNATMGLDSQFRFRTMFQDWSSIEFLAGNTVKKLPLGGLGLAAPDYRLGMGRCGTVVHYTMQVQGKDIVEYVDAEIVNGKSYSKILVLQSTLAMDSMRFINGTNKMHWTDNDEFDNRMIVYHKGKNGLYKLQANDSIFTFTEILPQEFDNITLINNKVIVQRKGHADVLEYYLANKKMRFSTINYLGSNYLRYKKNDNSMGWMHPDGTLFDDL